MAAIEPRIVRMCCEYTRLICQARALLHQRHPTQSEQTEANCYLAAARMLYDTAPPTARHALDACKRVMELSVKEHSVAKVLLAASVLL